MVVNILHLKALINHFSVIMGRVFIYTLEYLLENQKETSKKYHLERIWY